MSLPNTALTCLAYAKINLTLEILRKRPDGYHEVVTVMQTVGLHDTLTFTPSERLNLVSDDPAMTSSDNLILRAARDLQVAAGVRSGANINLEKKIPLAGGLGGGSSDAGVTLRALDKLWKLEWSTDRLSEIAAGIGSDVPFFLLGGSALAEGRGEIITPLPSYPRRYVLLVCPRIQLADKTRVLYGKVTRSDYADGSATRRLVEALQQAKQVQKVELVNSFLPIVLNENPAVNICYQRMQKLGIEPHLSGAGPTLFGLLDDETEALRIQESLLDLDADIFLTHTISADETANC